jgi:hypothetical protein
MWHDRGITANLAARLFVGAVLKTNVRLGRWVARAACAIGVGVAVLSGPLAAGIALAAPSSASQSDEISSVVPKADVIYSPADFVWT